MKRNLNQMDRADLIEYIRGLEKEIESLEEALAMSEEVYDEQFAWDYQEEAY